MDKNTVGFEEGLHKHLRKCELEYRAANLPQGCCVDWLAPFCESTKEIAEFLRGLGFKIAEIIDETDCTGEEHRRVITTSGIVVFVNHKYSPGFMVRTASHQRGRNKC